MAELKNVIPQKPRKIKANEQRTKNCSRCGKPRNESTDFYDNIGFESNLGKDLWCRDCVSHLATKDQVREYFWENNRAWSETIWDSARAVAEKKCLQNDTYKHSGQDRKKILLDRVTCQHIPNFQVSNYKYEPHEDKDGRHIPYPEAKVLGYVIEEKDPDKKYYNSVYNGHYSAHELEYLEKYCRDLNIDNLNDAALEDQIRKLAVQSLIAANAQDLYRAGKCDFQVVKDALSTYDMMMKSTNLAACKRAKDDNKKEEGSWAQAVLSLELSDYNVPNGVVFPEDDIDRILQRYNHIVVAIGSDS